MITLSRNEPCHCGSGKKYKKCHLPKDEEKERKELAKAVIKPTGEQAVAGKKQPTPTKGKNWFSNVMKKGGNLFRASTFHNKAGGGGS